MLAVISLFVAGVCTHSATAKNSVFVFGDDPFADKFRYDIHYSLADIQRTVSSFPGNYEMVAVGSSDWTSRLGEVSFRGPVSDARWWWGDSSQNGTMIDLGVSDNPFEHANRSIAMTYVGMGLGDPETAHEFTIPPEHSVADIHDWVVQLCNETLNADNALVRITGKFRNAQFHVDASVVRPKNTSVKFNLNFDQEEYFDLGGVYTRNMTLGQHILDLGEPPVHLHGFSLKHMQGGHVDHAQMVDVVARIYTVSSSNVFLCRSPADCSHNHEEERAPWILV